MSARVYNLTLRVSAAGIEIIDQVVKKEKEVGDAADEAGKKTQKGTEMGIRGWRSFLFSIQMGVFYLGMFSNALTTAQMSQLRLEDAQKDYNNTLREYGFGSEQAIDAARRLELAQMAVGRATWNTQLMTVGLILQTISFALEAKKAATASGLFTAALHSETLAHLKTIAVKIKHITVQSILNALTGRWVSLAVAAIAAGTIGTIAGYAAAGGFEARATKPTINIEGSSITVTEDVEQALEEDKRQKLEQLRRFV